ncbi:MAG: arylsulfatase [Verrucomicrobiota bacterium]
MVLLFLAFPTLGVSSSLPNIIYILADDLGYGDLSCYGQKRFETPNIDSLAEEGMRFTAHYSGSSVCAPSRCSLLTGLHTGHAQVRGNAEVMPEGQMPMEEGTFSLARMLKNQGYVTGLFGKWGLGAPESVTEPLKVGFDRFYGYNCQRLAHHYYPYFLWDDDRREILWDNFGLERGVYAPTLIHEQALSFIDENRSRPFFCYYALIQPHAEMLAPEYYMEKYRGKFLPESSYSGIDGGPDFRKFAYASQPEGRAAFAAMVNNIDDYVGDIVGKLKELGIDESTLIIFTSDNGPHEVGGHDPDFFDSNGPLRGYKRDLYEGGIRVPMIARWPGKIRKRSVSDHVCAFWDVMPTLADLAGVSPSPKTDGVSFLPTLLGGEQEEHKYLYWEFHERKGRLAIRKGKWKGVRYNAALNPTAKLELYNLMDDPGEELDLAEYYPEVVDELDKLMKGARVESPVERFNFPIGQTTVREGLAHEIGD